jgi:hypothetical protein
MLVRMRFGFGLLALGLVFGCSGSDGDNGGSGGGGTANTSAGTSSHAGSGNNSSGSGSASGGSGSTSGGSGSTSGGSGSTSGGTASASGGTGSGNTNDMYADARTRCVDRINELRASKGKGPIPRLASAESCADGQAKSDSESGKAHGAFNDCADQVKHWSGIAQNECPGYKSVEATLTSCIDMMWAEGPGGGHYDNMMGGSTHMACGFYTTPDGKVWQVQDYWTE